MSRRFIAIALPVAVGAALCVSATSGTASAAPKAPLHKLTTQRAMYDVGVHSNIARPAIRAASVPNSIPNFSATIADHGTTFTYDMAGKNPQVTQATPSTSVKTVVVPLKFVMLGDTFDASHGDACDSTSAVTRTLASPIFAKKAFSFGGTSVGTTQYVDAFQRANFWKYTKPGAINPGYHVLLNPTTVAVQTIQVPAADAALYFGTCTDLGGVDIDWLDTYLQTTLIPHLKSLGVNSTVFPMFVSENVFEYLNQDPNQCCVLGFHNAFSSAATGNHWQTYGISMYDNTGSFKNSKDVSVLSHEVGEWMDDPFVNNPTKPWGHVGQVSGCQQNLEVGDPLSGTIKSVVIGSKTYHVQEMAFFSWFFHQSPSIGINGKFSNYGKFTTSAAPCP